MFEVRQGYKSKDSKRQNADIANASSAYANNYLPVLLLLSTQIDSDIADRYTRVRWLLLPGELGGSTITSTYVFCDQVLGYDLGAFFNRNSARFRSLIEDITEGLLQ